MTLKNYLQAGLFILASSICVSCGSNIVRGQAPLVRISELSNTEAGASVQLNIRNLNGEVLDIQAIAFKLSVEDEVLIDFEGPSPTNITANGTEVHDIDTAVSTAGRQLLLQLQNGDIKSLAYSLEGKVTTAKDRSLHFSNEGHIYPVPGRPGHFH